MGPRERPAAGCPVCGKPAAPPHRPFCSARCKTLDLGRWLDGSYRLEGEEAAPSSAEIVDLSERARGRE